MLWYSLEAPQQGASNEYLQHMFSWRNKKAIMWPPPLICNYGFLVMRSNNMHCGKIAVMPTVNSKVQDKLITSCLIRALSANRYNLQYPMILLTCNKDPELTVQMGTLIWASVALIWHETPFLTLKIKLYKWKSLCCN